MKKKEDRRVKFTKMFLRNSLIDLLESKNIEKITISEICKNADINRATFYAHYSDQYDLLRSIEKEYIEKITTDLTKNNRNPEDIYHFINDILIFVKANARISKLLLSDRGDINFQKEIVSLVYNQLYEEQVLSQPDNPKLTQFMFSYAIYGCVGIILKWSEEEFESPTEEVARIITQLSTETML